MNEYTHAYLPVGPSVERANNIRAFMTIAVRCKHKLEGINFVMTPPLPLFMMLKPA